MYVYVCVYMPIRRRVRVSEYLLLQIQIIESSFLKHGEELAEEAALFNVVM